MSIKQNSTNFIACGGGKSISQILKDLSNICSFKDKKIAYVIIAAESDKKFLKVINSGFDRLRKIFELLGAKNIFLVKQKNISDLYNAQIVIFSGGDTSFLIKSLKKENFAEKIQKQDNNIETIVGISAGAIVLFEKGIGTKNNEEYIFDGLGLLPGIIIVHSNDKLQKKYPRAIHLKDYELYKKRIKKTALSKRYS